MIHEVHGAFLISAYQVWRPGAYATKKAARMAQRRPDEVLQALQDKANQKGPRLEDRCITEEDLRGFKG